MTLLSLLLLQAEDACQHSANSFACVQYIKNYDADTVTFNIPSVHPLIGEKVNIRVRGIDAPEIRTKNSCEKRQAQNAKQLVGNLLKKAKRIDLKNIERGKYFRIVADVIVDGKNLSEFLIKNDLAYAYDGGKKQQIDWCRFKRNTASD